MSIDTLASRIAARFRDLDVALTTLENHQLAVYFWLMAKWNRTINLTALPVEDAEQSAVDRLLVEPFLAAKLVSRADVEYVDLGSGGGSPAFPLLIGAPWLRATLVESKERKCAFLREVGRQLGFNDVSVQTTRFESFARFTSVGTADLVSFRAVRADSTLWTTIDRLLKPGGRAFWFGAALSVDHSLPPGFASTEPVSPVSALDAPSPSRLCILRKKLEAST